MNSHDIFEMKQDTASVYSMDSAYQSQSGASRSGAAMDGYQTLAPQDTRSQMGSQFLGSPTLDSEFNPFPEQYQDMSQMQLPLSTAGQDVAEPSFAYANYTTGQDFAPYTAASVPRYTPTTGMDMGFSWNTADTQAFASPFNYNMYNRPSMDAVIYSGQSSPQSTFSTPAFHQQGMTRPRIDTIVRPVASRNVSSLSAVSTQGPTPVLGDMRTQKQDTSIEVETLPSNSPIGESPLDDDELLSPSDAAAAKDMEEEQGQIARSHPLYQAQPDDNGKYHCPNEGKPGCNHKPTPLKCNYDKYVDSHLKPFRCHKKICVGVQFSSTACLLRHEREAHGMHGHGSRPHLCHFADCDRAVPGNGFPRRYNLFDHMKRVHDFSGPTTEPSPPAHQPGPARKSVSRKRKAPADEAGEKRSTKVTKLSAQQQLQRRREALQEAFLNKKQGLMEALAKMNGPSDLGDDAGLDKEVAALCDLATDFKKLNG